MLADWCDDSVHMIRHDHEFTELIAHPVKVHQTGFHDSFAVPLRQDAPAVTCVEPAVCGFGEAFIVFIPLDVSVRLWVQA